MVVLIAHAAATWLMTGLIWFVQLVHYPLLAKVEREAFVDYEREHCERTGWIAGPLMVVEALLAGLLWWQPAYGSLHAPGSKELVAGGLVLVALIWMSTFGLQTPDHGRLCERWDPAAQARLVRLNWIRTVLWTVRSGLAGWLLLLAR